MKNLSKAVLGAALLMVPLAATNAMAADTPEEPTNISINASADAKQAPDLAIISGGVITQSKTAKAAMADNSKAMNNAIAALKASGIAAKDIQTSGFNISPQYVYADNKPPVIKGYQVSNTITLQIHDMTKVGSVFDLMVDNGLNNISGPNFTIEDQDKVMDSARVEAMKKAMARADLYAKTVGMRVKRVVTISENSSYRPQPIMLENARMMKASAALDAAPIEAGELSMTVNVMVRFELEK